MPSTVELVERYLEGDMVLEQALARDLLNIRRTSRWLIDFNSWDATEEAVVSALRRYDQPESAASIEEGFSLLREGRPKITTNYAVATVPNNTKSRYAFEKALETIGFELPESILSSEASSTYLIDESAAGQIQSIYTDCYDRLVFPICRVSIRLPKNDTGSGVALSILLETFSHRGIPLVENYSSDCEQIFLVKGKHSAKAYDVVRHLRGMTPP